MDTKLENYSLLKNNTTGSNLNYNFPNYNNYQSWSNVGRGLIKLSGVDDSSNIQTVKQDFSRLQRLPDPYATHADTNLSWVKNNQN